MKNQSPHAFANLPVKKNLSQTFRLSLLLFALISAASAAGLYWSDSIYSTDELMHSFLPNDVINLLVILPAVLLSMWFALRGKLLGLLFWPGALLAVCYNYMIYLFSFPPGGVTLMYFVIVAVSAVSITLLFSSLDNDILSQQLEGVMPTRLVGGVLIGFGAAFLLRAVSILGNYLFLQAQIPQTDFALNTSDITLSGVWILGGLLVWKRKRAGYAAGMAMLMQANILFLGLLLLMLVKPALTNTSFIMVDFFIILIMELIFAIPFILLSRKVAKA